MTRLSKNGRLPNKAVQVPFEAVNADFVKAPPRASGLKGQTLHQCASACQDKLLATCMWGVFVFTLDCNSCIYCYDTHDALL